MSTFGVTKNAEPYDCTGRLLSQDGPCVGVVSLEAGLAVTLCTGSPATASCIPLFMTPFTAAAGTSGSRPLHIHWPCPQLCVLLRSRPPSQLLQAAATADSSSEAPKLALWSGRVKHRFGSSTVELFHMTALLPEKNQEQFPPTLFVTELATQRDVKLGEHYVMRCRLDVLSEKQVGVVLSCVC